jgi:transposase-like protein/transposase Tn5 family protein/DDE family transposase
MLAPWAEHEMKQANLEDQRLNKRLKQLLSVLGERPQLSIPAACGGYAEMVAAYRFFDNEHATPEKILEPHCQRTLERMAEQSVVLLVQDTTELDLTRPLAQVTGAGPLEGPSRRGAFLHPLAAFTPDGTPLGCVWSQTWTRTESTEVRSREEKDCKRRSTPIEEKESYRWLKGLRAARSAAQQVPATACVCVGDSESDIYELFAEPQGDAPVHWLIRAGQDRALVASPSPQDLKQDTDGSSAGDETAGVPLIRGAVLAAPVLFTNEISVRGRIQKISCNKAAREQPRESRQAEVEVRATTVMLRPPRRPGVKLPEVTVNVVLVSEIHPPAGDVPVEWLLLTTLAIDTAESVRQIVKYYSVRFMIEVLFRVLKSGCRIEQRRFEHIDRLLSCVAVYLIVAWRTLMVCRMGHSCPDLDCEAVFEPAEWKSVWMAVQRKPLPAAPPKLGVVIRLVAQLGGYVNRANRADPPGPQTVWIGLQRTRDLAWAWLTFGPDAQAAAAYQPDT